MLLDSNWVVVVGFLALASHVLKVKKVRCIIWLFMLWAVFVLVKFIAFLFMLFCDLQFGFVVMFDEGILHCWHVCDCLYVDLARSGRPNEDVEN